MTLNVDFILNEWIPALESGKYTQGKHMLHNTEEDTWCCLGVACDLLADRLHLDRTLDPGNDEDNDSACERFNGNRGNMPVPACQYIGIFSNGALSDAAKAKGDHLSLATMNDHNYQFPEIIEVLRRATTEDILSAY